MAMMPTHRHPSSLLLSSLPANALVGIDLLSLTASTRFQGFTTLPFGWHFLFVGATAELSSRHGLWFKVSAPNDDSTRTEDAHEQHAGRKRQRADSQPLGVRGEIVATVADTHGEGSVLDWLGVLEWDDDTEQLRAVGEPEEVERWRQKLLGSEELQKALFPYRRSVPPTQTGPIPRVTEIREDTDASGTDDPSTEKPSIEPPQDFPSLASHITAPLLDRICGPPPPNVCFWSLDTGSASGPDAERERIPGLESNETVPEQPLGLLNFDLKVTWPHGAIGRERTEAARDRSWRLEQLAAEAAHASHTADKVEPNGDNMIVTEDSQEANTGTKTPLKEEKGGGKMENADWGSEIIGELQFSFLMTLCLANWSCASQWRRLLELCLTSETAVRQRPAFFATLLDVLQTQLRHSTLVENSGGSGSMFEIGADDASGDDFLKQLLRRFGAVLADDWGDSESNVNGSRNENHGGNVDGEGNRGGSQGAQQSNITEVKVAYKGLKDAVKEIWGWELDGNFVKQGFMQLEDGEVVELETRNAEFEDETGEYAPAIVEL